jgi:hypothetical protein
MSTDVALGGLSDTHFLKAKATLAKDIFMFYVNKC